MSLGDTFTVKQAPNFLPEYHGDDGDARYPSPRRLRLLGALLIDVVLHLGSMIAMAVLVPVIVHVLKYPEPFAYAALLAPIVGIGGNLILLPKWVHASVGELIFGLVQIRGSDGGWPGWRDLWQARWNSRRSGVKLGTVRRCDVAK
ncbi:hypothetical protein AB0H76_36770 [Nocardia sp. NPDC050712]|uniref:hypothetical protein n=1 Tax=Nocardia sp. NPDC050712 TaxID=3155518 RepID=UPI0033F3FFBB